MSLTGSVPDVHPKFFQKKRRTRRFSSQICMMFFLEAELYSQGYLARVAAPGGSGLVEGRLVGYQIVPLRGRGDRRGLIHAAGRELWMIEQVEKSCREIQTAPFRNVEVLGDAEVPVVNSWGS